MQSYKDCCADPIGKSDIPIVRREDKSSYVLRLATFVDHAGTISGLMAFDPRCFDRAYNRYCLIRDAGA